MGDLMGKNQINVEHGRKSGEVIFINMIKDNVAISVQPITV